MPTVRVGRFLIYGLVDPRDRCLRYVGKSHKRREIRLAEHIQLATNGNPLPVYEWIRMLLRENLTPEIFVLERIPADASWRNAERRWIRRFRSKHRLDVPFTHLPQTRLSEPVSIHDVHLLNLRDGG